VDCEGLPGVSHWTKQLNRFRPPSEALSQADIAPPYEAEYVVSLYMDEDIGSNARVYLRHAGTKLFYSGWHSWSADVRQALNLGTPEAAIQRARSEMLSQVEVVTRKEGSDAETVQPIGQPTRWP
jgi:hypothetical protein